MAAKHPGVARIIREAMGDAPASGALSRMAEAVGVAPSTVQRWWAEASSPDPEYWPLIETHLNLDRGEFEQAAREDAPPDLVVLLNELRESLKGAGHRDAALEELKGSTTAIVDQLSDLMAVALANTERLARLDEYVRSHETAPQRAVKPQ